MGMRPPAGPAGGAGAIRIARRTLLKSTGAALLAPALSSAQALQPAGNALRARWIWYPGQLAAYRHARLVRLAVERCVHVGYPANFRQPLPAAWFRKRGKAGQDIRVAWTVPVGRARVLLGGAVTLAQGELTVQVGESVAEVRDPDPKWFEQFPSTPIVPTGRPVAIDLPERALRYARLAVSGRAEVADIRVDARVTPVRAPAGIASGRGAVPTPRARLPDGREVGPGKHAFALAAA